MTRMNVMQLKLETVNFGKTYLLIKRELLTFGVLFTHYN